MLLRNAASLLLFGVTYAGRILRRDQTVSTNVRDASLAGVLGFPFQTTTITSGVTYWVSGQGPHAIFGNLDNSGTVVYSQTDAFNLLGLVGPLVVDYASDEPAGAVGLRDGNLVNRAGALISINDFGSTTGSTYNFELNSLLNNGNIQFCGRGDNTGSEYTLTTLQNLVNNGVITLEQYYGNSFLGQSLLGNAGASTTTLTETFTNAGAVRLINIELNLAQNVLGSGCFNIGTGSVLYLTAAVYAVGLVNGVKPLTGQSIYFSATTSGSLRFDPASYLDTAPFGTTTFAPAIYGFGPNRAFEFISPVASVSYSGSTLTVTFGTVFTPIGRLALNIGAGYTASGFYIGISNLEPAVLYRGTVPTRTIPTVCPVAVPVCADPAVTVTASFSSTIGVAPTTTSPTVSNTPITVPTTTAVATTTSALGPIGISGGSVSSTTPSTTFSTVPTTSALGPIGISGGSISSTTPSTTFSTVPTTSVSVDSNGNGFPSTTTGVPASTTLFSTQANGACTCPAPSITVYVTA